MAEAEWKVIEGKRRSSLTWKRWRGSWQLKVWQHRQKRQKLWLTLPDSSVKTQLDIVC